MSMKEYTRCGNIPEPVALDNATALICLLLPGILETFRHLHPEYYRLEEFREEMLLTTNVETAPITYQEMQGMIETGLRRGMCQVIYKEAKANNEWMWDDSDKANQKGVNRNADTVETITMTNWFLLIYPY